MPFNTFGATFISSRGPETKTDRAAAKVTGGCARAAAHFSDFSAIPRKAREGGAPARFRPAPIKNSESRTRRAAWFAMKTPYYLPLVELYCEGPS